VASGYLAVVAGRVWRWIFNSGRISAPLPPLSMAATGLLLLGLGVVTLSLVLRGEKNMGQYLKGAEGEERMARILSLLPSTYAVFHGLSSSASGGGRDFDHVVVGPTGLFVIETKNWSGTVRLEDDELLYLPSEASSTEDMRHPDRPPLDQVRTSSRILEERLQAAEVPETSVQPILCFASNVFLSGAAGVGGVTVCNADRLSRVLTDSLETPLSEQSVKAIELFFKGQISP